MKNVFLGVVLYFLGCLSVLSQSLSDIEGEYVLQEVNRVKMGDVIRYPFRGVSITYSIKLETSNTALFVQNVYERGKRKSQQSFKAKLIEKSGRVEFEEIWDSGEWIANGYIAGNQLVMNNKEKLTNYLVQKEIAIK